MLGGMHWLNELKKMRMKKGDDGQEIEDNDPMGMGEVWQFAMMLNMGLAWLTK